MLFCLRVCFNDAFDSFAQIIISSMIARMFRMMMVEEEQISFRSASPMYDSIEDYAHQIAEMMNLRSEAGLIRSGVSGM